MQLDHSLLCEVRLQIARSTVRHSGQQWSLGCSIRASIESGIFWTKVIWSSHHTKIAVGFSHSATGMLARHPQLLKKQHIADLAAAAGLQLLHLQERVTEEHLLIDLSRKS